jgi:hypothetical protein
MGLSDDQRAMLRLLAQREQGYEDIAALMGISVEEVRARVGDALAQLEREGKQAPDVPEPPVAEPPPAAPEVEETEEELPAAPAPPKKETPPAAPAPEPPASPAPVRPASGGGAKIKLPSDPAIRAAIAAGVLVVALLAIFLIVNGGGDSDSGTTGTTAAESGESETTADSGSQRLTKAVLEPVDGSEASGVAIFGRVGKKLALQIKAEGLEPTTKGTSYTLWLAQSPQRMLPLAETAVPKSGKIGAQFEVPVELISYLATETFDQLVITRTDSAQLKAALEDAAKEKETPTYTGTAVLAGTVTGPIVGIAKRAQKK